MWNCVKFDSLDDDSHSHRSSEQWIAGCLIVRYRDWDCYFPLSIPLSHSSLPSFSRSIGFSLTIYPCERSETGKGGKEAQEERWSVWESVSHSELARKGSKNSLAIGKYTTHVINSLVFSLAHLIFITRLHTCNRRNSYSLLLSFLMLLAWWFMNFIGKITMTNSRDFLLSISFLNLVLSKLPNSSLL